jgi:hypothetical protein
MTIKNHFGVNPAKRESIAEDFRLEGVGFDNNNGIKRSKFNELIFKISCDHLWGTEAQVKLSSPRATFYTDASGNPLDSSDSAVTFNDDDRIVMVHDTALTSNLVIDGQGKRLNITTDRNLELDLDATYKIHFDNCDESIVNLKTSETLTDSVIDNTSVTTISINNRELYNQPKNDFNLRVENNVTNPTFQMDVSFENYTFYDENGRSVVSSQITPLVCDLTVNRAVHVPTEGSASEQSSIWYYIHVFTRGDGVNDYLYSSQPNWSDVDLSDKPSYNVFVRTLSAARNDSSSDLLYSTQLDDILYVEKLALFDAGTTTSTTVVGLNIAALVPETAVGCGGIQSGSNANGVILTSNQVLTNNGVGAMLNSGGGDVPSFYVGLHTPQTLYVQVNNGTGSYGVSYSKLRI